MLHESHVYNVPNVDIIFQTGRLKDSGKILPHWHENPEFLYILQGNLTVTHNGVEYTYAPGDIAVINSNDIHSMWSSDGTYTKYRCLIVDSNICNIGQLPKYVSDSDASAIYKMIEEEITEKKSNYAEAVIGYIKVLYSILSRIQTDDELPQTPQRKTELVRHAIEYMHENYNEDLSLEILSNKIHVNKYYLSHIFKEVTGRTVLSQLNYIRCNSALSMLSSGKYSVSDAAFACGFSNLSYFSRTYKKIMGHLPAKDIKKPPSL